MMSPDKRKKLLTTGLVLTLLTTLYTYVEDAQRQEVETVAAIARPAEAVSMASQGQQHARETRYGERFLQDAERDIFQREQTVASGAQDVEVPVFIPPTPIPQEIAPVAVEPAAPVAPPLPFVYIGKYVEDGELKIFLAHRGANLVVKDGDVIQQTYKVEAIKPPLMTLRYIPMDVTQNLQIGELQ